MYTRELKPLFVHAEESLLCAGRTAFEDDGYLCEIRNDESVVNDLDERLAPVFKRFLREVNNRHQFNFVYSQALLPCLESSPLGI